MRPIHVSLHQIVHADWADYRAILHESNAISLYASALTRNRTDSELILSPDVLIDYRFRDIYISERPTFRPFASIWRPMEISTRCGRSHCGAPPI